MAEMKVSEMIEAEQVNDEDLIMIVQNGVNKKVPASKVGTGQAGGEVLPIGSIMQYSGNTIPKNWLLCNGQAVNRNNYSSLFSKIGTLYGEGDGSTTFNLPDLRGRVPVGKDENDTDFDTLGNTGGEKEHTLTIDKIPEHQHYIHGYSGVDYPNYQIVTGQGGQELAASYNAGGTNKHNTNPVGGGEPHNNLQPYIVQNYIIKAKQSAGVVATVVDGLTSDSPTDALSAKQGKILNDKITELTTYSASEEIKTGEKWTDGKPIYRKTLTFAIPTSEAKSYHLDVANLNIDTGLFDFNNSYIRDKTNLRYVPITVSNVAAAANEQHNALSSTQVTVYYSDSRNKFIVECGGEFNWGMATVTLRYTKTTD